MVEKNLTKHQTRLIIIIVPLLTLCGKRVKQSQWLRETDDSNQIS
jgi:hypothetical protein